jgi:hypothetical protein
MVKATLASISNHQRWRIVMRFAKFAVASASLLLVMGVAMAETAQDDRAREVIELNSRIMHQQILARDPSLFEVVALDQFLVVAPGGRIEDKAMAAAGVSAWDAAGIEVSEEQVIFEGDTAVLVGRIQIDGVMQPVGQLPPMKFMAVFIEKPDGWRLLSRSLTPCFPIAIERGLC